jgi:hypothetical protein
MYMHICLYLLWLLLQYVDDVLMDAPRVITQDMVNSLRIALVVTAKPRQPLTTTTTSASASSTASTASGDKEGEGDAYALPRRLGILHELDRCPETDLSGERIYIDIYIYIYICIYNIICNYDIISLCMYVCMYAPSPGHRGPHPDAARPLRGQVSDSHTVCDMHGIICAYRSYIYVCVYMCICMASLGSPRRRRRRTSTTRTSTALAIAMAVLAMLMAILLVLLLLLLLLLLVLVLLLPLPPRWAQRSSPPPPPLLVLVLVLVLLALLLLLLLLPRVARLAGRAPESSRVHGEGGLYVLCYAMLYHAMLYCYAML